MPSNPNVPPRPPYFLGDATTLDTLPGARFDASKWDREDTIWLTDVEGGALHRNTGAAWQQITPGLLSSSGAEVFYHQWTVTQATASDAFVNILNDAGNPVSGVVPVLTRPVYLHLHVPQAENDTATKGALIAITDGTTVWNEPSDSPTAGADFGKEVWVRIPAGTPQRTYTAQFARKGVGGTSTLTALATRIGFLRAVTG